MKTIVKWAVERGKELEYVIWFKGEKKLKVLASKQIANAIRRIMSTSKSCTTIVNTLVVLVHLLVWIQKMEVITSNLN